MKLQEFKNHLNTLDKIFFQLPDGTLVPSHFHVTEVGKVNKHFIDCGGKVRKEEKANLQLWNADDYDHRLHPEKLIHIVNLSQEKLEIGDLEIEVEYQGENTIGKYGLDYQDGKFLLVGTATDCLAREGCGVPNLKELSVVSSSKCTPNSGCC